MRLRIFSVTLMVVGIVILLTQAQTLWWGGDGGAAAEREIVQLEESWRSGPSNHKGEPKEYGHPIRYQDSFAIIRIPRLGANWEAPVVKGTHDPALALGVGWFPHSAMPGEIGNFSVAGHRCCASTHGEPFADLDTIQDGDKVIVETRTTIYTYVMQDWYITTPKGVEAVAAVPGDLNATPTKAYITLVTCNPQWSSAERLITHGVLIKTEQK